MYLTLQDPEQGYKSTVIAFVDHKLSFIKPQILFLGG